MGSFCPHDWHQTTETDMQHMALGGGDYEYAVWETETAFPVRAGRISVERLRRHDAIANAALKLAEQRGLIPYSAETFLVLMDEVEASLAQVGTHPKGGDAKQAPGESLSDAVGEADASKGGSDD